MKKLNQTFAITAFVIITVAAAQGQKIDWSGEWNYASRFAPATLKIKTLSSTKFRFEIQALNGATTGEISGVANIKGDKAFFDDRSADNANNADSDKTGCQLTFTHKKELIEVSKETDCDSYGGLGVTFGREYRKGKQEVREQNFVQLEVFPNTALDDKFKLLVGQDYEKFLDSFNLINDGEDKDKFGAKVYEACVRGICPFNTSIVMFTDDGKFWAAVLTADDKDGANVKYYSNVAEWTDKLPKTIEEWSNDKRDFNKNLTISYNSKAK